MSTKLTSKYFWWVSLLLALLIALLMTLPVEAADFRSGDVVVIPATEVIDDDLFIGGTTVEINGHVKGDLLVGGTKVIVNGIVDGSLFAGGQEVIVNGTVNGSSYLGGLSMTLGEGADIGRNLYSGGFSLETMRGSLVERSAYVGAYQALLVGAIGHDLNVNLGALDLRGIVGGDVNGVVEVDPAANTAPPTVYMPISIPHVAPGITTDEQATIGGEFAVTEQVLSPSTANAVNEADSWGRWAFLRDRVGEYITLLLIGAALLYFTPPFVERVEAELVGQTTQSFIWGAVVAIAFPVVLFLIGAAAIALSIALGWVAFGTLSATAIGLGGTAIAFAMVGFTFVATVITKVLVALIVGQLLVDRAFPTSRATWLRQFGALAAGVLLYEMLRLIPVVGWLIALAVVLTGLGAIYLAWRDGAATEPVEKRPDFSPA